MIGRTYKYDPEPDFTGGVMKLFHGLLSIQAEKDRQELIEEVKRTSTTEAEYIHRLSKLRNLGKI